MLGLCMEESKENCRREKKMDSVMKNTKGTSMEGSQSSDPRAKESTELRLSSPKWQYLGSHRAGDQFSSPREAGAGDADGETLCSHLASVFQGFALPRE